MYVNKTARAACILIISSLLVFGVFGSQDRPGYPKHRPLVSVKGSNNPIFSHPYQFAWNIFATINRPEHNENDNNVEWENWMEESAVYTRSTTAPVWQCCNTRKNLHKLLYEEVSNAPRNGVRAEAASPPPSERDSLSEIRINPAAFGDILKFGLWHIQGQLEAFRNETVVTFSSDAKEVKAKWKPIKEEEKPYYHWQNFTTVDENSGQEKQIIIGLMALAISTKDLPNWFWATWEHKDNDKRCKELGCYDDFGVDPPYDKDGEVTEELKKLFKKNGLGDEWLNYRLDGVQVDFTDSTGRYALLGNSILEGNILKTSSCMTCHARASINQNKERLPSKTAAGEGFIGNVDPNWFFKSSKQGATREYLPFDFVWSVARAK